MSGENGSKINRLLRVWPVGTVAVTPWLAKQGVYQQLAFEYERTGWLERVGHGAYIRRGDTVEWPGGVYAIQKHLGLSIHVGAKTALELNGLDHFVPVGKGANVYLFGLGAAKLPTWFLKHDWNRRIVFKMPHLFDGKDNVGIDPFVMDRFKIQASTPERAILEVLHLVPTAQSAEEALLVMEGLGTLRPKLVQELLERCRSVKVKRLFLAIAERVNHPWIKKLDIKRVDLGKGKRQIVRNGVLNSKYQITLPRP